jgi:hypothetical protein
LRPWNGWTPVAGSTEKVKIFSGVDLLACRAGLVGDQGVSQHLLRKRDRLVGRARDPDTALLTRLGLLEGALAAPAGVDLGLDHPDRAVKLTRSFAGIRGVEHRNPVRDRRAVCLENLLRLIFVDVHLRVVLPEAQRARRQPQNNSLYLSGAKMNERSDRGGVHPDIASRLQRASLCCNGEGAACGLGWPASRPPTTGMWYTMNIECRQ